MIIWKNTCGESWQDTIENGWEVSGKPGAFLFFIPKGALTHHPQAGGGMAFGHRALSEGDCGSCGSRWTMPQPGRRCCHRPCSRPCDGVARCHLTQPPSACANLPPAALPQGWARPWAGARPFSFCKKKQKQACAQAERRTNGDLSSGGEDGQPGRGALRCGRFRLPELFPDAQRV